MHEFAFSDKEARLFEMGGGFIGIQDGMVNIEDILNLRPGGVVRCRAKPADCIKVFPGQNGPVGCVAGWISEDE